MKENGSRLPGLKNDKERAAFIDAYAAWPLWIETKETKERYYRYDLSDGTAMVVRVYWARLFDYSAGGCAYRDGYGREEYYLLEAGKSFRDCRRNRSALIGKLKEVQRHENG